MSYASEVLADSPLAYWRLGEASGTVGADASGNGRDLTYSGATLGVAGLVGDSDTAISFPGGFGPDNTQTAAGAAWANVTTLTVECWVKTADHSTSPAFVDRDDQSSNRQFSLGLDSTGKPTLFCNFAGTGARITGAAAIDDGLRHHVVAVINGTAFKLRDDKVDVASGTGAGSLVSVAATVIGIGHSLSSGSNNVLNDTIDEVAIYGTALSDARIDAHYDAAAIIAAPRVPRPVIHGQAVFRASM